MPTDIPPPLSRPFEEMRLKYTGLTVDGIDVAMLYVDDDWVLPLVVTEEPLNACFSVIAKHLIFTMLFQLYSESVYVYNLLFIIYLL